MKWIFSCFILMLLISCKSNKPLQTVADVDLNKYAGTWYETARFPNFFEKGLECVTAEYNLLNNGKISVVNKGHDIENNSKIKTVKGTAWLPNENNKGQLKVRFFWPFAGDYFIIALDKNYQYALVGDPSRKYLWILNRTNTIADSVYSNLTKIAQKNNFDTTLLVKVNQNCN